LHAVAAAQALKMGKHVYCQKPLTQTVYEARYLRDLARRRGLVTQMGNQGSAEDGLRRAVEIVQAGVLGNVRQVYVWSNRPIWPQGMGRPSGQDPVPPTLDWDLWLGPAKERPYKRTAYQPFNWRGFYDFGCGALGDMACHILGTSNMALHLSKRQLISVECVKKEGTSPFMFPKASVIRFDFAPYGNMRR
jgi:predicted dehydrogenase